MDIQIYKQNDITTKNGDIYSAEVQERFFRYIDATPATVTAYRKAIRQFLFFLQAEGVTAPVREDVTRYRDQLKQDHRPTTVQNYITAVKVFFKFMEAEGLYKNIADRIKGAKISREHKKDYLTARQVKRLLQGIPRTTETGARDYAILSLLVTTGLRTIEISRANMEDLRTVGDGAVLFIQGKGRDERTEYVKIAPPVEEAIREYLRERGPATATAPLFSSCSNNSTGGRLSTRSISGIVKHHLIQAGYISDRLTAHSLRHTAGTLNLQNGATLEETQQLLRHKNINTTMIYLHHIDRAKNNSENRIAAAIF